MNKTLLISLIILLLSNYGYAQFFANCRTYDEPADPLTDSRFRAWLAGDTYLVYPDARSSIRFERLREGIQDAEKIRILKD